ncbi:family 16 glycosylhydrolase [Pseudonocardia sp. ICBG1293]|uniref:glycoside hydrolase family 16 protein n=1 Tax=Pseudonocardia sp. ICBG1293 TaxID=2844382 RepID=UPI001CCD1249|nr:glycoside hydrolase family 16 protein [Pseudonocardia sp. ICBG1293]
MLPWIALPWIALPWSRSRPRHPPSADGWLPCPRTPPRTPSAARADPRFQVADLRAAVLVPVAAVAVLELFPTPRRSSPPAMPSPVASTSVASTPAAPAPAAPPLAAPPPVAPVRAGRPPAAPVPVATTARVGPGAPGARDTVVRAERPDRAVTGLRRRVAHGAGVLALVLVAVAGLTWTVLVPPDGTAVAADPSTSALDNQLPPPPPPPPPQQWRQVGGDEFDGSRVDRSTWTVYDSPGGFGNGLRRPSAVGVGDGLLTVAARPRAAGGGVSGGVAMHDGQLYGRWEFRARTDVGTGYSPAILLWPDSERFPDDGELDMMEIPFGDRHAATAFVHYGAQNHILSTAAPGDFTRWHTFALDWLPDRITWYVDGAKRWETTDRRAIPTSPMHLAVQLDQGPAAGWIPAPDAGTPDEVRLQVDWARVFAPVDDAG